MEITRWEYFTLKLLPGGWFGGKMDQDEMQASLNQFGAQGWELVSCFDTSAGQGASREVIFVFKRPLVS